MCYASNKHYLKLPAWITEGINMEEEHFEIHTSLYFMIWAWKYKFHANETGGKLEKPSQLQAERNLSHLEVFQGNFAVSEECFQLSILLTSDFLIERQ